MANSTSKMLEKMGAVDKFCETPEMGYVQDINIPQLTPEHNLDMSNALINILQAGAVPTYTPMDN